MQRISPGEVAAGLPSDPLAFIEQNIANPSVAIPNPTLQAQPTHQVAPIVPQTSFSDNFANELVEQVRPKEPSKSEPQDKPTDIKQEGINVGEVPQNELLEQVAKPKKGPEDSIKDLRRIATQYKTQLSEKETAHAELQAELEKYKTGEAIPEVIQKKEERIAELEYYEKLHALKLSPEYQKKYVEPISELRDKAIQLANDYGVDPTLLNEAYSLDNPRERNQFLREHFDDVGAMEVKGLLDKIKDVDTASQKAEKEPTQALEKIKSEYREQEQTREQHRVRTLAGNSREGWTSAYKELSEGNYPELTLIGKEEHDKLVKPLVQTAAEEYGRFIKLLADSGTKDLHPEAAKILAKRFLLSQVNSVTAASREHHYNRAEEIVNESKRMSSMIRPPIGAYNGGGGQGESGPPKPTSPEDAANILLRKVGVNV